MYKKIIGECHCKKDADLYDRWMNECAIQEPITDKNKFMDELNKAIGKLFKEE